MFDKMYNHEFFIVIDSVNNAVVVHDELSEPLSFVAFAYKADLRKNLEDFYFIENSGNEFRWNFFEVFECCIGENQFM